MEALAGAAVHSADVGSAAAYSPPTAVVLGQLLPDATANAEEDDAGSNDARTRHTDSTEPEEPDTLMSRLVAGQKRQREARDAYLEAREARDASLAELKHRQTEFDDAHLMRDHAERMHREAAAHCEALRKRHEKLAPPAEDA